MLVVGELINMSWKNIAAAIETPRCTEHQENSSRSAFDRRWFFCYISIMFWYSKTV